MFSEDKNLISYQYLNLLCYNEISYNTKTQDQQTATVVRNVR